MYDVVSSAALAYGPTRARSWCSSTGPDRAAFEAFQRDPEHHDLHPLRQNGTRNYLWWCNEPLEDLRPLLKR
jgi:hypothetical protein